MPTCRIAYLIDTIACDTAGTQKQLLELIRRLDRARFEPVLVCLRESPWMKEHPLPCAAFILGFDGFLKPGIVGVIARLAGLVRERRIDIVQTFFVESAIVAWLASFARGSRARFISSRRDMGLGNEPWYHAVYDLIMPVVNRRFAGIVANGENVKRHVIAKERAPDGLVRVIHNGISVPEGPGAGPHPFDRSAEDVWIAVAASLTPVKRIDLLLEAMSRLKGSRNGVAVKAVILGTGPERERLVREAETLGVDSMVRFAGEVREVTPYLQRVDIGVLCSDREGFSNAILEYMACGLPVVATAVGGNTELVDDRNGACVPAGDPDALASALGRLAGDRALREALGRGSLQKIRDGYSWERSVGEWERYYAELAGGGAC